MKKFKYIFLLALFSYLIAFPVFAQNAEADNKIEIFLFGQQGCPHCAKAEQQLDEWKNSKYPELDIKKFNIVNQQSLQLFIIAQKAYEFQSQGVPTLFIGKEAIIGARIEQIEKAIKNCLDQTCVQPSKMIQNYIENQAESNKNDQATSELKQKESESDHISTDIIIFAIIIISIVCVFIIIKIRAKKKKDA